MSKLKNITCTVATIALLAACTPTHVVRGNLLQDYQIAEVKPGIDTRSDILKKLGSPTTKSTFEENTWYYLGQETEKRGILDPEVVNERIFVVSFNEKGVVQTIEEVASDRLDLPYERRKTPTSGNEFTVMQQLLGNLGKFNPEEEL